MSEQTSTPTPFPKGSGSPFLKCTQTSFTSRRKAGASPAPSSAGPEGHPPSPGKTGPLGMMT